MRREVLPRLRPRQPRPGLLTRNGGSIMRTQIRRYARSFSTFLGNLLGAVVKAAVTSVVLGAVLVSVMHYMDVPVPSAVDLIRGVSKLANALS
jgi:hypothetical protein